MFCPRDYENARDLRMIADDEVSCIRDLAEHLSSGEGVFVDGGAFLGGTALALGEGILSSGNTEFKKIISIDRFTASDDYLIDALLTAGIAIRPEQSFLSLFLSNVSGILHLIEVRAGDVIHVGEIDDKIDLLVLDIAKTARVNSFVLLRWFSQMVGGRSVLYHQDFHSPFYLWNAMTVGLFSDNLQLIRPKVGEAAVFKVSKAFDRVKLAAAAAMSPLSAPGLAAIRRAVSMFPPEERHTVQLAEVMALARMKRTDEARELFAEIGASPYSKSDAKWRKWNEQVEKIIIRGG